MKSEHVQHVQHVIRYNLTYKYVNLIIKHDRTMKGQFKDYSLKIPLKITYSVDKSIKIYYPPIKCIRTAKKPNHQS